MPIRITISTYSKRPQLNSFADLQIALPPSALSLSLSLRNLVYLKEDIHATPKSAHLSTCCFAVICSARIISCKFPVLTQQWMFFCKHVTNLKSAKVLMTSLSTIPWAQLTDCSTVCSILDLYFTRWRNIILDDFETTNRSCKGDAAKLQHSSYNLTMMTFPSSSAPQCFVSQLQSSVRTSVTWGEPITAPLLSA